MHVGEIGGLLDRCEPLVIALLPKSTFELGDVVKVVLERVLVSTRNHENVGESVSHGLFDDVLDCWFVNDRQHFFRHRLGRGKESGTQTGGGDNRFGNSR